MSTGSHVVVSPVVVPGDSGPGVIGEPVPLPRPVLPTAPDEPLPEPNIPEIPGDPDWLYAFQQYLEEGRELLESHAQAVRQTATTVSPDSDGEAADSYAELSEFVTQAMNNGAGQMGQVFAAIRKYALELHQDQQVGLGGLKQGRGPAGDSGGPGQGAGGDLAAGRAGDRARAVAEDRPRAMPLRWPGKGGQRRSSGEGRHGPAQASPTRREWPVRKESHQARNEAKGQPVAESRRPGRYNTELPGGQQGADEFFKDVNGQDPQPVDGWDSVVVNGKSVTLRPSKSGPPTVEVFDPAKRAVEKIRFT